jgi:hypothetical protein
MCVQSNECSTHAENPKIQLKSFEVSQLGGASFAAGEICTMCKERMLPYFSFSFSFVGFFRAPKFLQ